MQRSAITVSVLVATLLLGVWSGVAVCLCQLTKHTAHTAHSHAPAHEEQMACEHTSDSSFLRAPGEECCLRYSQPSSVTTTMATVDPVRQLIEADAPLINSAISLTPAFSIPIDPSEHGPPGTLAPRHLLISVFRI